ncbi:MAG: hypothetical protein LBM93_10405 [Oscillospiraceae bacterium]|jgi:antitoxin component of MazEF toxin-antitoxin module|nr:hypothetical protein [Oscillospiraceae bacterium]
MDTTATSLGNALSFYVPQQLQNISNIKDKTHIRIEAEPNKLIITKISEPRKHIPLAERIKDFKGEPYVLSQEDKEWLKLEPVGEEE